MASLTTIFGFIAQFVGLSVLHWSITIVVLTTSFVASCVRAWVRRGIARKPRWLHIPDKAPFAWMLCRVLENDWAQYPDPTSTFSLSTTNVDCDWGPQTAILEKLGLESIGTDEFTLDCVVDQHVLTLRQLSDHHLWSKDSLRMLDVCEAYIRSSEDCARNKMVIGFIDPRAATQGLAMSLAAEMLHVMPALHHDVPQDQSDKVAAVIQIFLRKLARCEMITWKHDIPWKGRDWQIDVRHRKNNKSTWILPLSTTQDIGDLSTSLATGLALWSYSVACWDAYLTELEQKQALNSMRTQPNLCFSEFSARILGSLDSVSLEEMRMWIFGKRLSTIPAVFPISSGFPASTVLWEGPVQSKEKRRSEWREPLRIYGLYNSSAFR